MAEWRASRRRLSTTSDKQVQGNIVIHNTNTLQASAKTATCPGDDHVQTHKHVDT